MFDYGTDRIYVNLHSRFVPSRFEKAGLSYFSRTFHLSSVGPLGPANLEDS